MARDLTQTRCLGTTTNERPAHSAPAFQLRYGGRCQPCAVSQARANMRLGLGATSAQLRAVFEVLDHHKNSSEFYPAISNRVDL